MPDIKPIFILSLQRSGSTLLQHILARHPLIATYGEPWFLLPFLSAMCQERMKTDYNHARAAEAMKDFVSCFPGGIDYYYKELSRFTMRLYSAADISKAKFFLDKSPGYTFIANQLIRCFAEAKFIFLWRNPLSIVSSWLNSFDNGRWRVALLAEELRVGLPRMIEACQEATGRIFSLKYEELVANPQHFVRAICTYLEVDYSDIMIQNFSDIDIGGIQEHQRKSLRPSIDNSSTNNWPMSFSNAIRIRWACSYIEWLGASRLEAMGYNMDQILMQVPRQRFAFDGIISDLWWLFRDHCELHVNKRALC